MALFFRCFAQVLQVKINYIVSPYKEHQPQMSNFSRMVKVFQCAYLYHSSLHHIHILETFVVILGITSVRKSWATETSSMLRYQSIILWKPCSAKRLRWCNDSLWLYKSFHLVFKYQLINFVFYHTKVWWAKFTEDSSKALTVQI